MQATMFRMPSWKDGHLLLCVSLIDMGNPSLLFPPYFCSGHSRKSTCLEIVALGLLVCTGQDCFVGKDLTASGSLDFPCEMILSQGESLHF